VKRSLFRKPPPPPKGLYLWGGVGRGKSMLMDFFVAHLGDIPARRVHFHAFMQEIHGAMHEVRKTGVEDAITPVAQDEAASLRLLAFDEMQITDITDAMIVGRLFEALFADGVVVVTTSNRVPDDLYKDGLNRDLFLPFIALIKERMEVHELASPTDYRQDRLGGETVYFTPTGAAARAQMNAIWSDLAGGDSTPLVLRVKGREVELPAFRNGVARAGFHDLCGRPLGPADFLALADAVKVLMIDDIPTLSRNNFNEAKRFVTLIDALYEARVRLICSAAARPEMLYLEGEGTFEFERTASRLREMQAADWGG
jgi:cell division protein ZapE